MDTNINIKIEEINKDQYIVYFDGKFDMTNVDKSMKIIYDLINKETNGIKLIFDFEQLEYINSKAIGYIIDIYKQTKAKNGKLALCSSKINVMDVFHLVGLDQLVDFYKTQKEAKEALF